MANLKGLIVSILRDSNYTGNSINKFDKCNNLVLVDSLVGTVFNATDEMPAVRIVNRNFKDGEYLHAEPMEPGSYAFGGSFIYTSDGRFRKVSKYPIPLHDRQMNLETRF